MTSRHHGRILTLAAGHLPALGEQMNVAIVLAALAIVLATVAAVALVRNGGAE